MNAETKKENTTLIVVVAFATVAVLGFLSIIQEVSPELAAIPIFADAIQVAQLLRLM